MRQCQHDGARDSGLVISNIHNIIDAEYLVAEIHSVQPGKISKRCEGNAGQAEQRCSSAIE